MRFGIIYDANYETKIDQVTDSFPTRELEDWLYFKNYGEDLESICIVLMCRNPEYNFKQRIRMDRKNKTLYIDLMLDYNYFVSDITQKERINVVVEKLFDEVPKIVPKYKLKDFKSELFFSDLHKFTKKNGWF